MQVRYPPHIRQLKANLNGTRKALRMHRKNCVRCTNAHAVDRPGLYCETGWAWYADEWKFIRALQRAGHNELTVIGDQLALF